MNTFKQSIILLIFIFITFSHSYGAGETRLTLEPLYGIETRLVQYPSPGRYSTSAFYGARFLYGTTLLSAEAEYTSTSSREDYPSANQKVEDRVERASLGVRTTLPMTTFMGVYFRAGGRASQGESVITTAGNSETKKNPLRLDPYAGAGIQVVLLSNLAINASATLIRNSENEFDAQYALGLSARFGNR